MPTNIEFSLPDITVGDRDHSLIEWILEEIPQRERFPIAVMLDQELARARIIPASEVPASIVTLGSHFLYREHETGIMRAGTLTIAGVLPGFDELDRASVLPKGRVADDTVRMGSHLEYRDETLGTARTATLVYPDEADISQGKISVLTPIGIALIGLKVGQSITWETRNGVVRELTLLGVRQPQYA